MRMILIVIAVVASLAAALHVGGGPFKDVLRGLHGGAAELHGRR